MHKYKYEEEREYEEAHHRLGSPKKDFYMMEYGSKPTRTRKIRMALKKELGGMKIIKQCQKLNK